MASSVSCPLRSFMAELLSERAVSPKEVGVISDNAKAASPTPEGCYFKPFPLTSPMQLRNRIQHSRWESACDILKKTSMSPVSPRVISDKNATKAASPTLPEGCSFELFPLTSPMQLRNQYSRRESECDIVEKINMSPVSSAEFLSEHTSASPKEVRVISDNAKAVSPTPEGCSFKPFPLTSLIQVSRWESTCDFVEKTNMSPVSPARRPSLNVESRLDFPACPRRLGDLCCGE
jgi:hypothetical protein